MQVSSIYTLLAVLGAFALTSADPYGEDYNRPRYDEPSYQGGNEYNEPSYQGGNEYREPSYQGDNYNRQWKLVKRSPAPYGEPEEYQGYNRQPEYQDYNREPEYQNYDRQYPLVKRSPQGQGYVGNGSGGMGPGYPGGGMGNPPLQGHFPIPVGEGIFYKIYSAHHKTCMTVKHKLFRLGSRPFIHRKSHYRMQTKTCDRTKMESASSPMTFQLIPTDDNQYVKIVWLHHGSQKMCAKEAVTGTWFENCDDKFSRYNIAEVNAQGQFKLENMDRGNQCLVAKMRHAMRSRNCNDNTPQMLWEAVPVHGN